MLPPLAHSRIRSVGYHVPEHRVASELIEQTFELKHFGLPPRSIERITGIRARRVSAADTLPSDLAHLAVLDALVKANLSTKVFDVIVYAAVSRDYLDPSTAQIIQAQLGAKNAFALDVSNACLSIFDGIFLVDALIAGGSVRTGLVCGGERSGDALRCMAQETRHVESRSNSSSTPPVPHCGR